MKIVCIGGGPGGLYTALLMKKLDAANDVTVVERNRADDTFGWGVVFSRETLGNLEEADPETLALIAEHFAYWDDIETFYGGTSVRSTGHGFCGLSRKKLLQLLQGRCTELGVNLEFQREVSGVDEFPDADLIVAADGVNSKIRDDFADAFKPSVQWRKCKFSWLGTPLPLEAFTFIFEESEYGVFQVHAYRFEEGLSTFIVECHEDVWKRAGLDQASEQDTVDFCEKLFAPHLKGHPLLTNRSIWRTFPTVKCEKWHHENIVLLGDAVHTAHFSIGSGTKLAMEDAIALRDAFAEHGSGDIEKTLAAYQELRHVDTLKLQKAADTSRRWFENSARYMDQDPIQFSFNLLTRSKRITYDNLKLRDPDFIARVDEWFAEKAGAERTSTGTFPPPVFTPYQLREMELVNRIVMSPMCMYSATDGTPNDWHLVHLGSRAIGGAGLIFTEMTDVSAEGRISPGCAGMYEPEHVDAWKHIVDFVHTRSEARIGMQLGHAGRKGATRRMWEGIDQPLETGEWPILSASPIPYFPHSQVPREMDREDMDRVRDEHVRAAEMAEEAGFDMLELHMAHGYLLASFISPLTNRRHDEYGGPIEQRMRYPLEVFDAIRAVWPDEKPMSVRISATDWAEGGITDEEVLTLARALKEHGVDIIDVSTGQTVPHQEPIYGRMYQAPWSDLIRHEVGIPTMSVGAILGWDHANTIIGAGRADLAVMARPHLRDPYLTLHAAEHYEFYDQYWPPQYEPAMPRPPEED